MDHLLMMMIAPNPRARKGSKGRGGGGEGEVWRNLKGLRGNRATQSAKMLHHV